MNTTDAKEHWEQHYGERDRVWSGRVNVRLAEVVSPLEAGHALDLGCGEGADACWLAERGWTVVAVDVSDTALQRAAAAAEAQGLTERIQFVQHDLSHSFPDGSFDLVSAQFLHSMVPFDRPRVLRRCRRSPPGWVVADRRPRWAAAVGVEVGSSPSRIPQCRGGHRFTGSRQRLGTGACGSR
jgi:SAM-dependent methyltransferase